MGGLISQKMYHDGEREIAENSQTGRWFVCAVQEIGNRPIFFPTAKMDRGARQVTLRSRLS